MNYLHLLRILTAILLLEVIILSETSFKAEAQAVPQFSSAASAEFSVTGKDTAGAPITLRDCTIAITSPLVTNLNDGGAPIKKANFPVVVGDNAIPLQVFFSGVADGQYKLWAQVTSSTGVPSAWTASTAFTLSNAVPAAPTGLKLVLQVTVTP